MSQNRTALGDRVVWVVDDSSVEAEHARRVLNGRARVEVFQDGSAALERLAAGPPPDVMVLDWVMPGITGVEVCRFLRSAEGGHAQVGVLLLTTHRKTDQIVEGLSAGANDYLAKPYDDAELLARVDALLRTRQLIERAEQAEALSFKLLQTAPDALIAVDDAGTVRFVNETARIALQREAAAIVGMPLIALLPELEARLHMLPGVSIAPMPDVKLGEHYFSPTLRWLPGGKPFSTIISLRDVTERRRLDARRLDFYSIIAHDLRSPLHTLNLRIKLLLEGSQGELNGGTQSELRKMDGNLELLIEMINDFLELSRLDNFNYEIESAEVDIGALLSETVETLRPQFEAHGLEWVTEIDRSARAVGDHRRLQQVLTNLISNAVKFTADNGTITARIERIGREVELSVIDTGRGIAERDLPTLFDRYTRASGHGQGQDKIPGTGLGLMIVREIVEAHGGRVGVESTLGVGSRFWFRVPSA
jgi:two-component system phosphate regulon sensor histidine kinase PhoR